MADSSNEMDKTPEVPATPAADAQTPAPAKSDKISKASKAGLWKRRIIRTLIALIAIGVILRVTLAIMLPWTLRRVANVYGLDITYERSDLYLTSGDAGLWHVKVTEVDNGQLIADVDYCRGDISSLNLLRR